MKFKRPTQWLGLLGAWVVLGAWSDDPVSYPSVFSFPADSINNFSPTITTENTGIINQSSPSLLVQSSGNCSTLIVEEEDNFAVLEAVTLTADSVILQINGQQTSAKLEMAPGTNRLSLIVEGVKLANSIPINQDNAGPDGTLLKRRLRIKELEKGIVEVVIAQPISQWVCGDVKAREIA